jgi:hypothetical protein
LFCDPGPKSSEIAFFASHTDAKRKRLLETKLVVQHRRTAGNPIADENVTPMATAKSPSAGRISRFLLPLTAICLFTGCTLLSVRKFDNSFDGLNAAASRSNSASGTLRILFVHGMGDHQPGYSQPLMQGIATRLNLSNTGVSRKITIRKESHDYGEINISNYSSSDGKNVRAYELTWSVTTHDLKKRQFASDATYASDRVLVNRILKEKLIDDALADPVLYIGGYRSHMQFPIMRAIEAILHDYQARDELAIITQSLGSYMCYDTLLRMSKGEKIMGEREYSADLVQDLIGHTNYVFMLANQLPLLELSEVSNPVPVPRASNTAVKALAKIRRQNKPKIRPQQPPAPVALHLVAFSDPNDLLSYPLDRNSVSDNTIEYSNVIVSVERSAILGVFAWPTTAHTGHEKSKVVMDLLAFGHNGSDSRAASQPAATH